MGTHIDVFVARRIAADVEELAQQLSILFDAPWSTVGWIRSLDSHGVDPAYIMAEGPLRSSLYVYEKVVVLSFARRIHQLYGPSDGLTRKLRTVISRCATLMGDGGFAVAAGGFGDTDHVGDLAFHGGDLSAICASLRKKLGKPAASWDEFQDRNWLQFPRSEDLTVHYDLGIAYAAMGLRSDALSELTLALRLAPKHLQAETARDLLKQLGADR